MGSEADVLSMILARKRIEVGRRRRWLDALDAVLNPVPFDAERGERAVACLRRGAASVPKVIAEVKFRSPSAGAIRPKPPGEVARVAKGYSEAGAAVVSVLADGPGFGGSVLDVRRAAAITETPVLFKEFVVDEAQIRWARAVGASLVLLIVRALSDDELVALVDAARRAGLEAVVEAADDAELTRALRSGATVVGVNARDLRTFAVDRGAAQKLVERIPADRVAVSMSGITSRDAYRALGASRTDAVLVGESLMRAPDPGAELRAWRAA
jgi:indole-3-glycerol phosphate synthase